MHAPRTQPPRTARTPSRPRPRSNTAADTCRPSRRPPRAALRGAEVVPCNCTLARAAAAATAAAAEGVVQQGGRMTSACAAVLVDLDGTLLDTETIVDEVAARVIEGLGAEYTPTIAALGRGAHLASSQRRDCPAARAIARRLTGLQHIDAAAAAARAQASGRWRRALRSCPRCRCQSRRRSFTLARTRSSSSGAHPQPHSLRRAVPRSGFGGGGA